MKNKFIITLGASALLIFVSRGLVLSQEETPAPAPATAPVPASAPADVKVDTETQWVWGEVLSIDAQKQEIRIKYLDYETDQEKQMSISVDEKTTYENAKSIGDIKTGDTAGIDYVDLDGKLIAKNISLERPEPVKSESDTAVKPAANSSNDVTPQDLNKLE
ncbi:MAG TPA: hypothetical protein VMD04_01665 [Candidatus Margulisiibacteriota bacterium]|nr:hypothetical protein [Candidatus Margulisiibacteriota bacterium]